MLHTMRRVFASLSLLVLVTLLISPQSTSASSASFASEQEVQTPRHTSLLPLTKFELRGLDGPYHTEGNLILGADNQPYLFHGMARDDLEYFCKGDGHYTAKELGYLGIGQNRANETYWGGILYACHCPRISGCMGLPHTIPRRTVAPTNIRPWSSRRSIISRHWP
jgi:hypothetical protein